MGDRLWAGVPSQYVTSQSGQLSLASLRGRLIEYHSLLRICAEFGVQSSTPNPFPVASPLQLESFHFVDF